mmetsp:Transcript_25438/g.41344  ORF Transcript_25438/g.41344 Transcript_25438/m.41344 type:complete len:101 (-) Transcript_25438:2431-2733(-)
MGDAGTFLLLVATLPIEAKGSADLLTVAIGIPFFLDDKPRLGGGAINAARGSPLLDATEAAKGVEGAASAFLGIIGGGANGLATSAGSSPGNIQRLSLSS